MKSSFGKFISGFAAACAIAAIVGSAVPALSRVNLIHERVNASFPSFPPANSDNGVTVYTPNGAAGVQTIAYSVPTASTHSTVIPAVSGKRIRVLGLTMSSVSAGTLTLETSTSNVVLNTFQLASTSQTNLVTDKFGYGDTVAGDALLITVTGTTNTVAGNIRYVYY